MSAKAFLATKQRIPGLGNGVLQDILFNAGIHPKTKIETLSDEKINDLYESVKSTLSEMTKKGSRDTEKDLFGNYGGYTTKLSKKTMGTPCPVCGSSIVRQAYLGGNVYFCPICQKEG
jgi:formamidopyrimidine-DNA glycosylase